MWSGDGENQLKKMKKGEEEEEEAGDRISSFSDELLHKILSFTSAKVAVQTCVLSKRWKSLWKSLPYLDFNYETFPFKARYNGPSKLDFLTNFITQMLFRRRHRTDLVKVCFQSDDQCEKYNSVLQGLIAYAVDHNVQQLTIQSIHYNGFKDFMMPQRFYTCKTLTALHLVDYKYHSFRLPKLLALPALKSLYLDGFSMSEKYFNPGGFSACPNLEALKLMHIKFEEDKTFLIDAPTLKRLELSACEGRKVLIDAPALTTFQYCAAYSSPVCSFVDLGSVEDAHFDIYNPYPYGYPRNGKDKESDKDFHEYREYVLHYIKTFKKFHQAKSLTLSWKTVVALSLFPSLVDENRFPFSNLKSLKIKLVQWQPRVRIPGCVLNFFINCLPLSNLKQLKINLYEKQQFNMVGKPEHVLNFLNCSTTLKIYV